MQETADLVTFNGKLHFLCIVAVDFLKFSKRFLFFRASLNNSLFMSEKLLKVLMNMVF